MRRKYQKEQTGYNVKKKITVMIFVMALLAYLTGCKMDFEAEETVSDEAADKQSAEIIPVPEFSEQDFAPKNDEPVIRVDCFGYNDHDIKTAFFSKGKAGDVFYVVDADSKERIFESRITEKGIGEFSDVTKEGRYYIEASHIGRSYIFFVQKDRYRQTFEEIQSKVLAYADKESVSFEERLLIWDRLLQCFRDDFAGGKDAGIASESEKIRILKSGADALISESDPYKENASAYIEDLAVYSASMAMFYQTVREYDEAAAEVYLSEAEDSYIQVEAEKDLLLDEAYLFYPAAALYCATGKAPYESVAEEYLSESCERDFFEEKASEQALTADEMYVFGVLAYLNTTYKVDMDICEALMQNLSAKAELFADCVNSDNYFCVAQDLRNRVLADRLYVIAIVENVIVDMEYTNIVKNGIHYLGGCNQTGSSYFTEYGVFDTASDDKSSEAFLGSAYLGVLDKIK